MAAFTTMIRPKFVVSGFDIETRRLRANAKSTSTAFCCEVVDLLRARLGFSPAIQQHLANSRIEFLKSISERIEHVSKAGKQGTKIPVE